MSELDVIGALTGTDKSSSVGMAWDYLRHYEQLFAPWRHADINMIEIGVALGSSLAAWEQYFDRARLVGIDVNPQCKALQRDRVAIYIGSQDDPELLHRVATDFPPTIVIEDGSHIAHHMIASFERLFPALAPGGYYVFEDLSLHFAESAKRFEDPKFHQGHADTHIYDYLNKFIRARAACVDVPENTFGFTRYAFEHIDSITVAAGFIAVRKKAARNLEQEVATFEQLLARGTGGPVAAQRFAEFLLQHGIHLERAAALLRDNITAQPADEAQWRTLLNVQLKLGWLDDAAEAASHLVQFSPGNISYWDQLANIQRRRSRPELELTAVRRLTELQPASAGMFLRLSELQSAVGDLPAARAAARRASQLEPDNAFFGSRAAELDAAA